MLKNAGKDFGRKRKRATYQAIMSLIRVSDILRKFAEKYFQQSGITRAQFNVLLLLKYEFRGGCSQSDLCKRLLVHPTDVTGLVRRMLKNDLVNKERSPGDERSWLITITTSGMKMLDNIEVEYYESIESLMRLDGDEPAETFLNMLEQLERNIMAEMKHRLN